MSDLHNDACAIGFTPTMAPCPLPHSATYRRSIIPATHNYPRGQIQAKPHQACRIITRYSLANDFPSQWSAFASYRLDFRTATHFLPSSHLENQPTKPTETLTPLSSLTDLDTSVEKKKKEKAQTPHLTSQLCRIRPLARCRERYLRSRYSYHRRHGH